VISNEIKIRKKSKITINEFSFSLILVSKVQIREVLYL
jgi:hypothetical protein